MQQVALVRSAYGALLGWVIGSPSRSPHAQPPAPVEPAAGYSGRRQTSVKRQGGARPATRAGAACGSQPASVGVLQPARPRSEEHTSELQSRENLVCRLLLEKKKR